MITRSREREIEMELRSKCKPLFVQITEGSAKKPRTFDPWAIVQQGRGHCNNCRKPHDGVSWSRGLGWFKCGDVDHIIKDCPLRSNLIFSYYNETGHKKAGCSIISSGAARAPAPATLRITNDREGKEENLVVRSRAFQLQTKEAWALPDFVATIYHIYFLSAFIFYVYDYVIM